MTLKENRCNKSSRAIVKYIEKKERKYFEQAIEFEQKAVFDFTKRSSTRKGTERRSSELVIGESVWGETQVQMLLLPLT